MYKHPDVSLLSSVGLEENAFPNPWFRGLDEVSVVCKIIVIAVFNNGSVSCGCQCWSFMLGRSQWREIYFWGMDEFWVLKWESEDNRQRALKLTAEHQSTVSYHSMQRDSLLGSCNYLHALTFSRLLSHFRATSTNMFFLSRTHIDTYHQLPNPPSRKTLSSRSYLLCS